MTGKRLLDAAAMYMAARGVASKHLALRIHQLNVYSKTSTLVKAVQSQSDRVTFTVKAGAALANRFDESGPQYSTQNYPAESTGDSSNGSRQNVVRGSNETTQEEQGLAQDHFNEKSNENTTAQPLPEGKLAVRQAKAEKLDLPDETTPSTGNEAAVPRQDGDTFYEIPKTKPGADILAEKQPNHDGKIQHASPKKESSNPLDKNAEQLKRQRENPIPSQAAESPPKSASDSEATTTTANEPSRLNILQEQEPFTGRTSSDGQVSSAQPQVRTPRDTKGIQESDMPNSGNQINNNAIHTQIARNRQQAVLEAQAIPEQNEVPEETYSEIFHSRKVAKMLRERPRQDAQSEGLELAGAKGTPIKNTKMPQEHDQVSSSVRTPAQDELSNHKGSSKHGAESALSQEKGDKDVHALAADIFNDADNVYSSTPDVSRETTALSNNRCNADSLIVVL